MAHEKLRFFDAGD